MKIHVLDGVFEPHQLNKWKQTINYSTEPFVSVLADKKGEGWYEKHQYHVNYSLCSNILEKIEKYFNVSNMVGYDYWTHTNTRPTSWHYDKDEIAYVTKGVTRYPICSSVFYMEVDCDGGSLQFKNGVTIKPVVNRLVIFSPKLYHGVEQFTGKRVSININPWNTKLYPKPNDKSI